MAEKKTIALKVTVDTSEVEQSVEKTTGTVEDLGKTTKKTSSEMKQGFKAAEQGTKGLGSSIGGLIKSLGIIGAAMVVFNFMKDLLMKNQKIMDALNVATTALEILLNKLFESVEPIGDAMASAFEDPKQAISDLWDAIKLNLINRLEGFIEGWQAVGKAIKGVFDLDWDAVKNGAEDFGKALIKVGTGLDEEQQRKIVDGVKNFANETLKATEIALDHAKVLTVLQNELELLEAGQKKVQMTYQRDAELQRQRRDDIRLTLAERIDANDKLGTILDNQIKVEQVLADKRLALAIKERDLLGANTERKAKVLLAEGELADLRERIAGQESEQITNQAALEKELFDIQQELRVATLDAREKELEELDIYYEALQEKARLAGETDVEIESAKIKALEDLKNKFIKEDLDKEADATKKRVDMQRKEKDARLSAASGMIAGLGSLVEALGNQSKASVAIQKTLAIAQIAIDTAKSISAGIAGATTSATATGPGAFVATPVFIATTIATILGAVGSAVGILNSVPGGGGASVPSISVPTASAAPSFNPVTTNTTELGGTEQAELAPIQAFVVETQITGNQENVNQIEGQAEFGGG
tara:strand:- start:4400 stop:6169 length:1770 start_codon:yes stop_codon:yes gene_type:complete